VAVVRWLRRVVLFAVLFDVEEAFLGVAMGQSGMREGACADARARLL
jgi:hypothetical protein